MRRFLQISSSLAELTWMHFPKSLEPLSTDTDGRSFKTLVMERDLPLDVYECKNIA